MDQPTVAGKQFPDWVSALRYAEELFKAGKISEQELQQILAQAEQATQGQQPPAQPGPPGQQAQPMPPPEAAPGAQGGMTPQGLASMNDPDFAAALRKNPRLVDMAMGRPPGT